MEYYDSKTHFILEHYIIRNNISLAAKGLYALLQSFQQQGILISYIDELVSLTGEDRETIKLLLEEINNAQLIQTTTQSVYTPYVVETDVYERKCNFYNEV